VIDENITQQNAEVKSIVNKVRQVAPKRMPLGVRLVVNTQNMGGRFVQSVKNAQWSVSLQETGDGLESIVEFQVKIKGHNQREYASESMRTNGKDCKIPFILKRGFQNPLKRGFQNPLYPKKGIQIIPKRIAKSTLC